MGYGLEDKLVIGVASSALFDLSESDKVFRENGIDEYRESQREKQSEPLKPGVAFPFIQRLLSFNKLSDEGNPIEVVLLSKNDPDTGMRVMNSIAHHELNITRATFLQGRAPYSFIPAYNISLFLSANEKDVREAIDAGHPAGQVLDSQAADGTEDQELRISFDFDGVVVDDESETVYQQSKDVDEFNRHEVEKSTIPHNPGPLANFLKRISVIQQLEREVSKRDNSYTPKLRVSIVTARSAPAHERVVNTLRDWGIIIDEAFFLGGIEKKKILEVLKPHIFFDDQKLHLEAASTVLPSVHIPFGITNKRL